MRATTAASKPVAFPVGALAVHALGGLFLAAGLVALFVPELMTAVPALTDRTTAWSVLGAGIALDVGATLTIIGHLRAQRRRPTEPA